MHWTQGENQNRTWKHSARLKVTFQISLIIEDCLEIDGDELEEVIILLACWHCCKYLSKLPNFSFQFIIEEIFLPIQILQNHHEILKVLNF